MNMTRKTLHSFIILRGYLFLFQFSIFYFPSSLLSFLSSFLYFTFWPGICGKATVAYCSMFGLFFFNFSFLPCVGGLFVLV